MRIVHRAVAEPRETRAAYWEHLVADTFGGMDLRFDEMPDSRDEIVVGEVGPVTVLESRSGPGEAQRTARHIRADDPDRYALFVQVDGSAVGEQDGRCAELRPGDMALLDLSTPMGWAFTERRAVVASYPKALSPLRNDELSRLTGVRIAGDRGIGALVSGLVRQLPVHLDADDGAAGARIGSAVLDLLNVGLAAHLDREQAMSPEASTRAMLLRCRSFIEQHLHDTDLTPTAVASAHHISLRHLHRLFQPTGNGVAGHIRCRRLDRVRRDLLDPDLVERPVSSIGARWGLTDGAHFSRAFKAIYGLPPAEYRATYADGR